MNYTKTLLFIFLAVIYLGVFPQQQVLSQTSGIVINEMLASNSSVFADEDGDFGDWIELYCTGSQSINLKGFGLSDNSENPFKWVFPDTLINPGEYFLIWASGKNRTNPGAPLHTSFNISVSGEAIILSQPDGSIADELPPIQLRSDISYGRFPDGTGTWFFFIQPTPKTANITNTYSEILDSPQFSSPGGFYPQSLNLNLTHPDEEVQIYYTLDGSVPDPANLNGTTYSYKNRYPRNPGQSTGAFLYKSYKSYLYANPIPVYDISGEPDRLTQISSTFDYTPNYFPLTPVKKGTVVRAKAMKEGAISSETISNTYFLFNDHVNNYSLPVISLTIQEDLLFDYEKGIYVAGIDFDKWRLLNPSEPVNGGRPANYRRRGDEWELPAQIELFLSGTDRSALTQKTGIRIHGGYSRSHPTKSIRLYARSEYGESSIDFPFFEDRPYASFKRLVLRNSGNDRAKTFIRDAVIHKISGNLNFDTQAYQPAIVFINGEYWGLLNIRERNDNYYLAGLYDIDPENLDILNNNANIKEGDRSHYNAMLDYMEKNDMKQDVHYEYIKTQMDITNFTDYQIAQIFIANTDWPHNNIDFWRLKTDEYMPDSPYGHDGRWRWLMFDTDFGLGGNQTYNHNTLQFATQAQNPQFPNRVFSTFLLRTLLTNDEFRLQFISRFADLLNTTFLPDRMTGIINEYKKVIEPEMPAHIHRWRSPGTISNWNSNVKVMQDFAIYRPTHQRQHIKNFFNLESEINIKVDVNNPAHGYIRVNTIDIKSITDGINEDAYPWIGKYFTGIPLDIEACAHKGYVFSHWEGDINSHSAQLNITPSGSDEIYLKAHFEKLPDSLLIHYWHFNNLPAGILENINADYSLVDSATLSYPGTGAGFMDRVTPGSVLNMQMQAAEGSALRLRNPSDTRELLLTLPSTGFEQLELSYAAQRTGNGAQQQQVFYSVNGGMDWLMVGGAYLIEEDVYNLIRHDLTAIEEVNNNPHLRFKILFTGDNASGTSGNQRIDNISLFGIPTGEINLPPVVVHPLELQEAIEQGEGIEIDLNEVFSDPDNDAMGFHANSSAARFAEVNLNENRLTVTPVQRGEAVITLKASDGVNDTVTHQFRVLVYPKAWQFDNNPYTFSNWSHTEPEYSYPENMLFLQSEVNDPGLETPLLYPYYIAHDDYHADDPDKTGFPYSLTGRTRINALEDDGISFINTGRGRDLGGALLAFSSKGISNMELNWLAGTVLQNSRVYGIRLQYRLGITGNFQDVLIDDQELEYMVHSDGHELQMGPVELPEQLMDTDYVQLLWRYYFREGTSGARAEIRLDDITLTPKQYVNTVNTGLAHTAIYSSGKNVIVNIQNNTSGVINIYSVMGRKVFTGTIHHAGRHVFEMSSGTGLYVVRLETDEGCFSKKVFIE